MATVGTPRNIWLDPASPSWVRQEVAAGGGRIVESIHDATAVVWMSPRNAEGLRSALAEAPQIDWVQLPFAGVENFVEAGFTFTDRIWTCGKGVYAEPVAEHVVALALAGLRMIPTRVKANSWAPQGGLSLLGEHVTILGGGGIAESLCPMLAPFGCQITVLRKRPGATPLPTGPEQLSMDALGDCLRRSLVVVIALALTPETANVIGAPELQLMRRDGWIVNVGRGGHVDTDAMVDALHQGLLGGYATDVTEPEPLPDGHPLWTAPNVIITPHTANTLAMARGPLGERIRVNVQRYLAGLPLIGPIDPGRGY
jgi:phosphoglycerate dehydrogenase-like enzyme